MDMTIIIRGSEGGTITQDVIKRINQSAGTELDWKIEQFGEATYLNTICKSNFYDVEKTFEALLNLYPTIDISSSRSFSVRENDYSAEWWGTERISTEKRSDGTSYLSKSSSTYWN